jgi:hypothetical protein
MNPPFFDAIIADTPIAAAILSKEMIIRVNLLNFVISSNI